MAMKKRRTTRVLDPGDKTTLAHEVWRHLFDLAGERYRALETHALKRLGLTTPSARLLQSLRPDQGTSMTVLADTLQCDASNVTWLVDSMVAAGAVERRPSESDGRVKMVHLTSLGRQRRVEAIAAFYEPPRVLSQASVAQLRAVLALLSLVEADAEK